MEGIVTSDIMLRAAAGLAGGFTRVLATRQEFYPDGLSAIFAGIATAVFLYPVAAPFLAPLVANLNLEPSADVLAKAFLLGLIGITVVNTLVDLRRDRAEPNAEHT